MAKKSKTEDGGEIFIIGIILLLLALLIVAAPIYLLGASIFHTFKYKAKYSKLKGNYEDFWLTSSEKEQFKKLQYEINEAKLRVSDAIDIAIEHEVATNKDGRYSARSEVGKNVQNIIDQNMDIAYEKNKKLEILSTLPQKRWNDFLKVYQNYLSNRISLISYLIILIIVCQFNRFNLSIQDALKFGYNLYRGIGDEQFGISKYVSKQNWLGMILITVITVSVFMLTRVLVKKMANKVTPKPPQIDIENIDEK